MSDILHLTLKKQWFDLTKSRVKLEEYREIKPYWIKRLCTPGANELTPEQLLGARNLALANFSEKVNFCREDFREACLVNGYGSHRPTIYRRIASITIGQGREEWGAKPGELYFVISYYERT